MNFDGNYRYNIFEGYGAPLPCDDGSPDYHDLGLEPNLYDQEDRDQYPWKGPYPGKDYSVFDNTHISGYDGLTDREREREYDEEARFWEWIEESSQEEPWDHLLPSSAPSERRTGSLRYTRLLARVEQSERRISKGMKGKRSGPNRQERRLSGKRRRFDRIRRRVKHGLSAEVLALHEELADPRRWTCTFDCEPIEAEDEALTNRIKKLMRHPA